MKFSFNGTVAEFEELGRIINTGWRTTELPAAPLHAAEWATVLSAARDCAHQDDQDGKGDVEPELGESEGVPEEKPKRHRRTKAQIEADKQVALREFEQSEASARDALAEHLGTVSVDRLDASAGHTATAEVEPTVDAAETDTPPKPDDTVSALESAETIRDLLKDLQPETGETLRSLAGITNIFNVTRAQLDRLRQLVQGT